MERCGAPGIKLNIKDVEWIRPQIHATPIQIDHWGQPSKITALRNLLSSLAWIGDSLGVKQWSINIYEPYPTDRSTGMLSNLCGFKSGRPDGKRSCLSPRNQ